MRLMLALVFLFAVGCHGPLTKPMVDRLDDDTQSKVDEAWLGMFTPPDRLDRTLLLDCILRKQLHQYGVDYLRLLSEKRVGDGLVVMEVRYDREDPVFDEFSVTLVDHEGYEVRRERFTRQDVEDRIEFFYGPIAVCEDVEDMDAELRAEMERRAEEIEARQREIEAVLAPLYEHGEEADEASSPVDG